MTSVNRLRLALVGLVFIIAAPLRAGEPAYDLDIEPQPLAKALKAFAEQSGLQVVYYSELADGEESPEVSGKMTADQAMTQLLASTELTFDTMGEDTVVVETAIAAGQRGDSDSKNLSPKPVLMAQTTNQAPTSTENRGQTDELEVTPTDDSNESIRGRLETIVVTGSRNTGVRRSEDDPQPYLVFDLADIENSLTTNVEDFLRTRLPQNAVRTPFSVDQGIGAQLNGNQSSVNLRGLGTDQTLILVNGRRLASRNTGGFSRGQPDINAIPLSAIERIEVLPSTASGIYGGGATGGAINIIMKKHYAGADVLLEYGNTFDSDVSTRRIDAVGGLGLESGRTTVLWSFGYSDSNDLLEVDRGFNQRSRDLLFANDPESLLNSSTLLSSTVNIRSLDGDLVLDDGTPLGSPITFVPFGYGGPTTDNGAAFVANAGQFNLDVPRDALGDRSTLLNAPEVLSGSLFLEREFTDWMKAFVDVSYYSNEGRASRNFSGTRITLLADAPNNPFNNTIRFEVPNPDASLDVPLISETESMQAVGGLRFSLPGNWGGGGRVQLD